MFWSLEELLDAQIQDRSIRKVAEWVVAGAKPVRPALSLESAEVRKLVGQWPLLTFRQGLLCRWKVTAGRSRRSIQVVVPAKLRAEVLAYCHGHRTAAHFGRKEHSRSETAVLLVWNGERHQPLGKTLPDVLFGQTRGRSR